MCDRALRPRSHYGKNAAAAGDCLGLAQPVLLAKWLVSLTSDREVPGSIPTGSRFFCAVTRGTGYSWPGMRVKCILYTVSYIILGRNARLYFDVKLKYLYLYIHDNKRRSRKTQRQTELRETLEKCCVLAAALTLNSIPEHFLLCSRPV